MAVSVSFGLFVRLPDYCNRGWCAGCLCGYRTVCLVALSANSVAYSSRYRGRRASGHSHLLADDRPRTTSQTIDLTSAGTRLLEPSHLECNHPDDHGFVSRGSRQAATHQVRGGGAYFGG